MFYVLQKAVIVHSFLKVSSERLDEPGTEHATPSLQANCTTAPSILVVFCSVWCYRIRVSLVFSDYTTMVSYCNWWLPLSFIPCECMWVNVHGLNKLKPSFHYFWPSANKIDFFFCLNMFILMGKRFAVFCNSCPLPERFWIKNEKKWLEGVPGVIFIKLKCRCLQAGLRDMKNTKQLKFCLGYIFTHF